DEIQSRHPVAAQPRTVAPTERVQHPQPAAAQVALRGGPAYGRLTGVGAVHADDHVVPVHASTRSVEQGGRADRELADSPAGRVVDRVGDRGGYPDDTELADTLDA